jgi:hypothetical protein
MVTVDGSSGSSSTGIGRDFDDSAYDDADEVWMRPADQASLLVERCRALVVVCNVYADTHRRLREEASVGSTAAASSPTTISSFSPTTASPPPARGSALHEPSNRVHKVGVEAVKAAAKAVESARTALAVARLSPKVYKRVPPRDMHHLCVQCSLLRAQTYLDFAEWCVVLAARARRRSARARHSQMHTPKRDVFSLSHSQNPAAAAATAVAAEDVWSVGCVVVWWVAGWQALVLKGMVRRVRSTTHLVAVLQPGEGPDCRHRRRHRGRW